MEAIIIAHPERSGFEKLGQTWSSATPTRTRVNESGNIVTKDVLVFGNGYHTDNDVLNRTSVNEHNDQGAIYIVDSLTGDIIHEFNITDHSEMVWSIPSRINVVDHDLDGIMDSLFVGDLGGNIWRIDFGIERQNDGTAVASTPVLILAARLADRPGASLDPSTDANPGGDRRFFHAPDIALVDYGDGVYHYGVSIGSGRQDVPNDVAQDDQFYFIHLPVVTSSLNDPVTHWDLVDVTSSPYNDLTKKGWYINLNGLGEKMLSTPLLIEGVLTGTTYAPANSYNYPSQSIDPCGVHIGGGRFYAFDMRTGQSIQSSPDDTESTTVPYTELSSSGIPPSPAVILTDLKPDTPVVLVGTETVEPFYNGPGQWRVYWMEE